MTESLTGRADPHEVPDAHRAEAEAALAILCDSTLEPIVDMVCLRRDGAYEAVAHGGRVVFRRANGGFERITVEGVDPLADQATDRFTPLAAERARPYPTRAENAYPHTFEQIAQLFDSPAAPDLCVLHSAATTGKTKAATAVSTVRSGSCRPAPRSCSAAKAYAAWA